MAQGHAERAVAGDVLDDAVVAKLRHGLIDAPVQVCAVERLGRGGQPLDRRDEGLTFANRKHRRNDLDELVDRIHDRGADARGGNGLGGVVGRLVHLVKWWKKADKHSHTYNTYIHESD